MGHSIYKNRTLLPNYITLQHHIGTAMSTQMMVDDKNQLQEVRVPVFPKQPALIRCLAEMFSYIFHPVFVPVYLVVFMVFVHPYLFAGFSSFDKLRTVIMAFVMYTFFPVVTVLLLKALKFVQTFRLHSQKDRIIPLVACGVWYFWIWYVWRNLPDYPAEAVQLTLAVWVSASLGFSVDLGQFGFAGKYHYESKLTCHCYWCDAGIFISAGIFAGSELWYLSFCSYFDSRYCMHFPFYSI